MLVLGFAIGFGFMTPLHHAHDAMLVQSSADDEGAIL
jgi:hypothetical protein